MEALRGKSGSRDATWLRWFGIYFAAFLVILAPSHRHDLSAVHEECATCQVSTQPCEAPASDIAPILSVTWMLLPDAALPLAPSVSHFHFASRAPPSA